MRKLTLLATMLALVLAMMALSAGPASAQTNTGTVNFDNTGNINIKATCSNVELANITFGNDANRICNNNGFSNNGFLGNNQEDEFFTPVFFDGFGTPFFAGNGFVVEPGFFAGPNGVFSNGGFGGNNVNINNSGGIIG